LKTLKDGMTVKRQTKKPATRMETRPANERRDSHASPDEKRDPATDSGRRARPVDADLDAQHLEDLPDGNGVVHALHGVSFDIPRGEYIAIIGPSVPASRR
jgi:ABC-type glutathione transport system ATPase component